MSVSTRYILAGTVAGAALIGTLHSVAIAQGAIPNIPGVTQNGVNACCTQTRDHNIHVPGVNVGTPQVHVATPHISVHQGEFSVQQSGSFSINYSDQQSGSETYMYSRSALFGGGFGYAGGSLDQLNVEGASNFVKEEVTEEVPVTQEYCVDRIIYEEVVQPIQAVCIDPSGTPHPASQVMDDRTIDGAFNGEVFRCMAGTSMQVTVGHFEDGRTSFETAETFSCETGEALVHRPGGNLECAPQAPRRNCNERSLLRKYGPGVKVIQAQKAKTVCEPKTKTVYETRVREVVSEQPLASGSIVFDGGVGLGVQ